MATTIIEEFDAVSIRNASIQFIKNGTQEQGTKFGLVGQIEGETELSELTKKVGNLEVKKVVKPNKMNLTVSGHIPVKVLRDYFGLTNLNLKPGIYAYGTLSKGHRFVFTADVVDEFEDLVKLIAFANCNNTSGFKITIENGSDEVAMMELEFTVLADDLGNFYYETLVAELSDQTVAENWHKEFKSTLVTIPTP